MKGTVRFERLYETLFIGEMRLRNRIVMSPILTNFGSSDGHVTEQPGGFYVERVKGDVGLVIVEATCVDFPIGKASLYRLVIDNDSLILDMNQVTEDVEWTRVTLS